MVSLVKKYSDGRFSFVLSENNKVKGECFFSPFTAEIFELKEYSSLIYEEKRSLILSVLNNLELSGKDKAFYFGKTNTEIFLDLKFKESSEGEFFVDLKGYFDKPCCR